MTDATPNYDVWTDEDRNVLYLRLVGDMNREQIEDARAATVETAETFDGAFHIINDISEFAPGSPEETEPIKRGQAQLTEMDLDQVVRVADEDTSSVTKMTFQVGSVEAGYSGDVAPSIEAAERTLFERT